MPVRLVGSIVVALLAPALLIAQERLTPPEALARAEKLYAEDRLPAAEPLYRRALDGAPDDRRRATDRLLTLYARLGRYDQAIQLGQDYRRRLDRLRDMARLRYLALQLGEYYLQLGHHATAAPLLEESLASGKDPLRPAHEVVARTLLAQIARQRQPEQARKLWAQVEPLALKCLEDAAAVSLDERITCARCLGECYRQAGLDVPVIPRLAALVRIHDRLDDPAGKLETLRLLAARHTARKEHHAAYRCLLGALTLYHEGPSEVPGKSMARWRRDRLSAGDLCNELAETSLRLHLPEVSERWRQRAILHYQAVMKDPTAGRPGHAGSLAAYWKLHQLFQRTNQFARAVELARGQEQEGGVLLQPKLRSELGTLQTFLGSYDRARELLRQARKALQAQSPINLVEYPRALHNLAVVEQVEGHLDQAFELSRRTEQLYRDHGLPDDLLLVETHNLLGTCLAQRGEYTAAIARFRAGIACCGRVGSSADRSQCNLLLNVALLHKAQGDHVRALDACRQARAAYLRLDEPDGPALAAFDVAEATLHAARGKIREAATLSVAALERCGRFGLTQGVLVTSARHYLALQALLDRQIPQARQAFGEIRAEQGKERQSLLLPRTLNYLALGEELAGHPEEAEKLYREAMRLQEGHRAFPATQFITLWRLALLVDARGSAGRPEARELLEKGLGVAEAARRHVYGDAQQRAGYLAQFSTGFEQLIEWNVRDGDIDAAVIALDRGRSRALLDQLYAAGVDPLDGIPGPTGQRLRKREGELRRKLAGIRAQAQLIPIEGLDDEKARQLLAEMDRAREEYAELWREVYSESPVYRGLATRDSSATALATVRRRLQSAKAVLLVYHLGPKSSHLLLVEPGAGRAEAFPLTVSADVAGRIATAPPSKFDPDAATTRPKAADGTRGLLLRHKGDKGVPAPVKSDRPGPVVPLTTEVARAVIEQYRFEVADPGFQPTRGLRLRPRNPRQPVIVQRLELTGDLFLPAAARNRLRDLAPEMVVVVPDGPLHAFPMEAFLLSTDAAPRYVLDELPPIVYAPSASALALFTSRPQAARKGAPSLLTVANPSYPRTKAPRDVDHSFVTGLRGELPPLPFTAVESKRIRAHLPAERAHSLEGDRATEEAVVTALAGKHLIHLAAHGFADERFGNLFGALALTPPPPGKESEREDGFLSLHEIYRLPLTSCELAVLSACSTHVGPQLPLEAGVTLASGFLTAGARRVVASHWCVDDRSTAELMTTFFADAIHEGGRPMNYAKALYKARQAVRKKPGWEAPFYWAPFVLLGAPDVAR